MLYTIILQISKEILLKIFKDVNTISKDIFKLLEILKFSDSDINKLLIN
jgi:hypothetical protein